MNLFNSYIVKKVADKVDETVFTPFITANAAADESGAILAYSTPAAQGRSANQTGVLLGLCAPEKTIGLYRCASHAYGADRPGAGARTGAERSCFPEEAVSTGCRLLEKLREKWRKIF